MSGNTSFSCWNDAAGRDFFRPQAMGILNVTPDSFYSTSRCETEQSIALRADEILNQGATIIDIGGVSTRPGAAAVDVDEEKQRLRRALEVVRRRHPEACLSVDTFRPEVAEMAVRDYGVEIVNDVSGGSKEMFSTVALTGATYVLTSHESCFDRMCVDFRQKVSALLDLGHSAIILDPGYGFGKTLDENYTVLRRQMELSGFGLPVLAGVSRKRMAYELLSVAPDQALNATTVLHTIALINGATILRVHDVKEALEAIRIVEKLNPNQ